MVISRASLKGVELDLAGAAAVIALALTGYLLLLRGPMSDVLGGHDLEQQQAAAARDLVSLQSEYGRRFRELEQSRSRLESQSRWLSDPTLPADVLSRINEMARQCEVRITRWQPQGVQTCKDYQEQRFSLEGVAAWPGLIQWLAVTEQGVPLLDLTHLAISAPGGPGQKECEFSCSLKLYRGRPEATLQVVAAQP